MQGNNQKIYKTIRSTYDPQSREKGNLPDDPDHQGTGGPNRDQIGWER